MEKSLLITKSLGLVIFSSNFFWYKVDCFVKYCTKEGGFSPLLEIGALSSIFLLYIVVSNSQIKFFNKSSDYLDIYFLIILYKHFFTAAELP